MAQTDAQLESHEERLQRVESSLTDTQVQVSAMDTKLGYLGEQIQGTRSDLATGFGDIKSAHREILGHLAAHSEKLEAHEDRLIRAELHVRTEEKKSKTRKDAIKKVLIAALLAMAGVFGTKVFERLWGAFGG
jgi:chromosome segregation ATPase